MRCGLDTVLAPDEEAIIKNMINSRHNFKENFGEPTISLRRVL